MSDFCCRHCRWLLRPACCQSPARASAPLPSCCPLPAAFAIKQRIYGNRIVLFAPLYIANYCVNNCRYCAFRQGNKSLEVRGLMGWQGHNVRCRHARAVGCGDLARATVPAGCRQFGTMWLWRVRFCCTRAQLLRQP